MKAVWKSPDRANRGIETIPKDTVIDIVDKFKHSEDGFWYRARIPNNENTFYFNVDDVEAVGTVQLSRR